MKTALEKKVSYKGQEKVDTLSSRVRIEEGKGRIIVNDGQDNRMIIGAAPDGKIVVAITKIGEDIFDAYNV